MSISVMLTYNVRFMALINTVGFVWKHALLTF